MNTRRSGWRGRGRTGRALEAAARATRPPRDGEDEIWERLEIQLPAEGGAVVDEALSLAGKVLGAAAPKWERLEAICQEYLGAHPVEPSGDEAEASAGYPVGPSLEVIKEGLEHEFQQWRWLDEIHASGPARRQGQPDEAVPERAGVRGAQLQCVPSSDRGPGPPVLAPVPDSAEEPFVDVVKLDADLRRIAAMRARWDDLFGHLAMLLQWTWLWRDMKFASFGHYAQERLGMAERTVTQHTWLERKLYSLPKLRQALREERISYEKARHVASIADEASLEAWIAQAERSTCIELRRHVQAYEEKGQMRAAQPPAAAAGGGTARPEQQSHPQPVTTKAPA